MAAGGGRRDGRAAVRAATGHRDRPRRRVALVAAAQAAAVRNPRHVAGGGRDQLRDAGAGPPDARPRPRPDHRRLRRAVRPARRDRRHPRRHRAQARPGRRVDRRRGRDRGDRRRDGCVEHRGARRFHRRPAGGRGVGCGGGIAHPTAAAPAQRGRSSLRACGGPGHFGGRAGSVRRAARRHRRGSGVADVDRLARRPAPPRLVAAAHPDGRRPTRPHCRGGICPGHDRAATHPDRRRGVATEATR